MVRTGIDSTLLSQLARGEYVVNERAVAEAIVGRIRVRQAAHSDVLVTAEALQELPLGPPKGDAAAGSHAA